MSRPPPPPAFAKVALDLAMVDVGARFGRISFTRFPDPLGFGKGPSRFSDPRRRVADRRFGVLYLGSTLKVCFIEAVLRDQGDGRVGEFLLDELDLVVRSYAAMVPCAWAFQVTSRVARSKAWRDGGR